MTLLIDPHPILTTPSQSVTEFNKELLEIVTEMRSVMLSYNGVGLAAPQVGISKQIITMIYPPYVMINPIILKQEGCIIMEEGCLSFPDLYLKIKRFNLIEVQWNDILGVIHSDTYDQFHAVVLQHEIDHTRGVVFTDRAGKKTLKIAKKELANRNKIR